MQTEYFTFYQRKHVEYFHLVRQFYFLENDWRLRTTVLLSHGVWTEATQVDISLCLFVRPGHELELCKPVKVLFAPKPVKRGI